MKKLIATLLTVLALQAHAQVITLKSPYNAQHAGHSAIYKIFEHANSSQKKYTFMLELKPGGQGTIALKDMDRTPATALGLIAAPYVQNTIDGVLNEADYVPVTSLGDACWFIISNVGDEKEGVKSLLSASPDLVGSVVGIGSATHLAMIEISDKLNRPYRYVNFKSAAEGNVLLAGNNGVNFGIAPNAEFLNLKNINPSMQRLAMHCERRHPQAPHVATTRQQGIDAPYVFNTVLASVNMPVERRQEIKTILDNAILAIGQDQILAISDFNPPVFRQLNVEEYQKQKMVAMKRALTKHRSKIEAAK
jgi:tripartite-type tricarboxylate transporter receptor subunit TctC